MGVPADHISVGVVFHTHVAFGTVTVTADGILLCHIGVFHQQHRRIHGLQGARPDSAGTQLVEVEHALGAAGQGVGALGHFTHLGQLTAELVDHDQVVALGHSIDIAVCLIVGHIIENHAHIHNKVGVGQVVLRHNIQLTPVGRSEDVVLCNGSCKICVVGILQAGSTNLIIVLKVLGESGPVILHQVESHHIGNTSILADLHLEQISGSVHSIIVDLNQELLAVDAIQGEGIRSHLTLFDVLLGAYGSQATGAGLVIQSSSGNVLIVGSRDGHGVVHHIHTDTLQFRGSVVNNQLHGSSSTLTQSVPIHIASFIDVVLRNQREGHRNLIALSSLLQGEVCFQRHHGILPAVNLIGVVGHIDGAGLLIQEHVASSLVDYDNAGLVSMTDGGKANTVNVVTRVNGVTLRHINGVSNHRIAAQCVVIVGVIRISDLEFVATQNTSIRNTGILASVVGGPHAHVKHGRICPVAIETQNGDGVAGGNLAVCILRFGVQVTLQVSTVGISLIQFSLHALGQAKINTNIHRTICRQHSGSGGQIAQEDISIVRVDVAVAVHISLVLIVQFHQQAGGIIQQTLTVIHIDEAVAVEVHAGHIRSLGGDPGATNGPDHIHSDHGSGVVHIQILAIGQQILNEEVGTQVDVLLLIGQIADGESCAVSAGPIGIVKQFDLNLTVSSAGIGTFAHDDEGVGIDGIIDVCQAGTLLQNGEVTALIFPDGLGSRHQQTLSQMTYIHVSLACQIVFLDVLRQQSSHTGNLGRSHGSTGLDGISAAVGVQTLQGENVAAGSGNLRLHFQRAGDTPGGEIGHGVVCAAELAHANGAADGHGTSEVTHITGSVSHGCGQLANFTALSLCQSGNGIGQLVISQVKGNDTALVVVDKHSESACLDSQRSLFDKVCLTTGTQSDLTGQNICHSSPVRCLTHTVDEDVLILASDRGKGFICELAASVIFVIDEHLVVDLDVVTNHTVVLNRSSTQRVGEGAGLTDGIHADVGIVQIAAIIGILHPCTGVAGRDGNHNTGLGQVFHNFLEIGVSMMATTRSGTTQRQVDGICAQNDSIFNSSKEIRITRRSVFTKDF